MELHWSPDSVTSPPKKEMEPICDVATDSRMFPSTIPENAELWPPDTVNTLAMEMPASAVVAIPELFDATALSVPAPTPASPASVFVVDTLVALDSASMPVSEAGSEVGTAENSADVSVCDSACPSLSS